MSEWTKTAPTKPGWYWCRTRETKKAEWPCQVWIVEPELVEHRNWSGDLATEFGPAIPTAAALVKAREALHTILRELSAATLRRLSLNELAAISREALAALGEPEEAPDAD